MSHHRPEIEQWLTEHGYPQAAIEKILLRLDEFDSKINRQSIFDAMETGEMDIAALIKEVMGETDG